MVAVVAGCWTGSSAPVEKPPEGSGSAVVEEPPPAEPQISLVTSFVVVEACPEAKKLDTRLATREIEELVGRASQSRAARRTSRRRSCPVDASSSQSPSGDPAEGIIPTCLVQSAGQLKHKLRLTKSCKFDVKLEQRIDGPAESLARERASLAEQVLLEERDRVADLQDLVVALLRAVALVGEHHRARRESCGARARVDLERLADRHARIVGALDRGAAAPSACRCA